MSKKIFVKYLLPVRPKMVPELKMLRIYWNLAHVIFRISWFRFWCQKLFLLNTTCSAKMVSKLKVLRIYRNLSLLVFETCQSRNWCQKWFLINIYHLLGPNWSQNWKFSVLMKLDTFDISSIPISILMSNIIFIKHLPPVRSRLVPELKVLRIYWNLTHSIFQICKCQFWCQKWFSLMKYLPIARPQQVPKWKMLRIYWNLTKLLFQTCTTQFWCQKWFLLNI